MTGRRKVLLAAAAAAAVLVAAAPATPADILPQNSVWNRLDMDASNPAPEPG